jgi:hypothetical protein
MPSKSIKICKFGMFYTRLIKKLAADAGNIEEGRK